MRKLKLLTKNNFTSTILFVLLLSTLVFGQGSTPTAGRLNIAEEDLNPSTFPYQLRVTNGTLTDNGDGTASLNIPGGVAETDPIYSNSTAFGINNTSVSNWNTAYTHTSNDTLHWVNKTTSDLPEGTNQYYTEIRFNNSLTNKTTTNLTEGNNLYYTENRFNNSYANATAKNPFNQVLNTTSSPTFANATIPNLLGNTTVQGDMNVTGDLYVTDVFVTNIDGNSYVAGNLSVGTTNTTTGYKFYVNGTGNFVGNLTALNLAGSNTGDETGATIVSKLGYTPYYPGGTDVAVSDGGTGKSSWTQYLIPYANTTTSFDQIAIGSAGQVLTSNGAGSAPGFANAAKRGISIPAFDTSSPTETGVLFRGVYPFFPGIDTTLTEVDFVAAGTGANLNMTFYKSNSTTDITDKTALFTVSSWTNGTGCSYANVTSFTNATIEAGREIIGVYNSGTNSTVSSYWR